MLTKGIIHWQLFLCQNIDHMFFELANCLVFIPYTVIVSFILPLFSQYMIRGASAKQFAIFMTIYL